METHLKALLIALALLALYALPAAAQDGSITITIDCGAPESITVRNDTNEALVLESVNSSEGRTSDVEIDLGNTEVAAGASETINFGDMAGGGNIFNNDLEETATVMISGMERQLVCDNGDVVTRTFQVGQPEVQPTEPPVQPTVGPEETPMPEATEVTLNFELTVSGDVPEGTRFIGQFGVPFTDVVGGVELADPDGDGVYTGTAESPVNQDDETAYAFVYTTAPGIGFDPSAVAVFPEDYETNGFEVAALEDGATVTAWVSFGGEVPGKMPPTGAGGLAAGASVPWGSLGLAASGLLAAGYAVLRRR